jgi:uncharacterized protein (DUF305 family)
LPRRVRPCRRLGAASPQAIAKPADPAAVAFAAENEAAMTRMMDAMMVKPSGDIDRDFALMMIPHHQGAIAMALAQLHHGRNEQLRRIAQEIIVEQLQEIAANGASLVRSPSRGGVRGRSE